MTLSCTRTGSVVVLVVAIAVAAFATGATAATPETELASPNWSGYVATPAAATPDAFTSATGTWKQPATNCVGHDTGATADIWVGIGGYNSGLDELQQVGTSARCNAHDDPVIEPWFEVIPYPAHRIPLIVRAGDTLTGTVTILPVSARLELADHTRGWTFTRSITWGPADTTSAEWIVEAPLTCILYTCQQARLANFGSVTFSRIAATAGPDTTTLANPAWKVTPLQLIAGPPAISTISSEPDDASATNTSAHEAARSTPTARAAPGPIASAGDMFTVTWLPAAH